MRTVNAFVVASLLAVLALPARSMDLATAYRAALEEDAKLRIARATADAGRERLPQARSQLLPSASLTANRNRNSLTRISPGLTGASVTTHENFGSNNETLSIRQPIYRKPAFAAYEQAKHLVRDAEATLEVELQDVGMRVSAAYMEALFAQDQLDLVLAQRATTIAQLDAARKALRAGSGTRTDVDEAQARLDLTQAQEFSAREQLAFTRRQLEAIVNRPVDTVARVDVAALKLLPPTPASVEDWVRKAEAQSPQVQALLARLEAARLEVEKARGGHYPTLDAVAQATRSASENVLFPSSEYSNRVIGLQLSVPIYQGGYVNSVVRQAIAERQRVESQLEGVRRDLGVQIHKEFRGVTEGIEKIRALEQAVLSAEQVVASSRRSFEAGLRTRLDILNAEQQRVLALRDLAQARYQYLISRVNLRALAGDERGAAIDEVSAWLTR